MIFRIDPLRFVRDEGGLHERQFPPLCKIRPFFSGAPTSMDFARDSGLNPGGSCESNGQSVRGSPAQSDWSLSGQLDTQTAAAVPDSSAHPCIRSSYGAPCDAVFRVVAGYQIAAVPIAAVPSIPIEAVAFGKTVQILSLHLDGRCEKNHCNACHNKHRFYAEPHCYSPFDFENWIQMHEF